MCKDIKYLNYKDIIAFRFFHFFCLLVLEVGGGRFVNNYFLLLKHYQRDHVRILK